VPLLNFRIVRPSVLIDVNRLAALDFVEEHDGGLRIGALTRHHTLETAPLVGERFPVLRAAMAHVAHLAIRNRGTLGGSLSHADPAAELPMLALLLDAEFHIVSATAKRAVAARDFLLDALTVDLRGDELLTEIVLPKLPPQTGWGFEEVARRHGDFALAAAAATLTISGGAISDARIALCGVGATASRATEAEALLKGRVLEPAVTGRVIDAVRAAIAPNTDLHASSDYRRHLAGVLAHRALAAAWRRANARAA
jgi:carbon-monoxide dehydrogenase medium subunit